MYEQFYGLREKPFNMTPDPEFLFFTEKHKEAFAHLVYGIRERRGFIEITGEVGAGKTTICRALLNEFDADTKFALILNPFLSDIELLRAINEELYIDATGETKKDLLDTLNRYLIDQHAAGHNVVLVIDEAQNLPIQTLEQIRIISNLETVKAKLIQIVLVGQPELRQKLSRAELRQLNQRITVRYHISPLSPEEAEDYIYHRLKVAGDQGKIRFTPEAIALVYKYTGGIPRMINILCDHALLSGFVFERFEIDVDLVKKAHQEIAGQETERFGAKKSNFQGNLLIYGVATVVLIALAFYAGKFFQGAPVKYQQRQMIASASGTSEVENPALLVEPDPIQLSSHANPVEEENPKSPEPTKRHQESVPKIIFTPLKSPPVEHRYPLQENRDRSSLKSPLPVLTKKNREVVSEPEIEIILSDQEIEDSSNTLSSLDLVRIDTVLETIPVPLPIPTVKPVEAVAPIAPKVTPGCFDEDRILRCSLPGETRAAALMTLARLWIPDSTSFEQIYAEYGDTGASTWEQKVFEPFGLAPISWSANLSMIRQINLPVVLEVYEKALFTPVYLTVLKIQGDRLILADPRQGRFEVDEQELGEMWFGRLTLLIPASVKPKDVLSRSSQGQEVLLLQKRLLKLGFFETEPNGFYGDYTEAQVRRFQRQNRIKIDGLVGLETNLVLFSRLAGSDAPRLFSTSG